MGYGAESLKLIKGSRGKPVGGTSLDPEKKVITISKHQYSICIYDVIARA